MTENVQQPARRVLAAEFNEINTQVQEDTEDEDTNAPIHSLLPTGGSINRVLVQGTITEIEDVSNGDDPYLRARVVDPTGTFFLYAGQYQPDAKATLQSLEAPAFVAVVGKVRSFETDDGDEMFSLKPESITETTREARNRWTVQAAEATLSRVQASLDDEPVHGFEPGDLHENLAEYDMSRDGLSEYINAAIMAFEDVDPEASSSEADAEVDAEAGAEAQA